MINEDSWFSVSNRTKLHLHSFCVFKSPRGWCKLVSGNVDKFRLERERVGESYLFVGKENYLGV